MSNVNRSWYQTFFRGVVLEMWRKSVPPEATALEADFLERSLELMEGARVLDVPCGGGRHAVALAERGYQVTGVDLSPGMIEEARARAATAGVSVTWREAEMRDLPWKEAFHAAYCLGNSFGYLDPAGSMAFLRAISAALAPGGRFAMDTGYAAESILPNLREREWLRADDILFLEENRYHVEEGCVETAYTFIRDGVCDTRVGWQWVYTVREILELFRVAGLSVTALMGSHDGAPFQAGGRYLILLATKEEAGRSRPVDG